MVARNERVTSGKYCKAALHENSLLRHGDSKVMILVVELLCSRKMAGTAAHVDARKALAAQGLARALRKGRPPFHPQIRHAYICRL